MIKLREDGEMACNEATCVDDTRVCGRGFALTKAACWQLASGMNSHGNQADAAKYREPTPTSGAYKGALLQTHASHPLKSPTGKKWTRFQDGLKWVKRLGLEQDTINTSELRCIACLGVHVAEVYSAGC